MPFTCTVVVCLMLLSSDVAQHNFLNVVLHNHQHLLQTLKIPSVSMHVKQIIIKKLTEHFTLNTRWRIVSFQRTIFFLKKIVALCFNHHLDLYLTSCVFRDESKEGAIKKSIITIMHQHREMQYHHKNINDSYGDGRSPDFTSANQFSHKTL